MNGDQANFPSGFAFRLIYNGKVLTSKMDGCANGSDLCDSQVLVKQVMPFAKYEDRDCASTTSTTPPADEEGLITEMETAAENLYAAPGGLFVIVSLVLLSMALGSAVTFFVMRRKTRKKHGYRRESALGDLSMRVIDDNEDHFSTEERPGIDVAVSANYGSTHGENEKELNEDRLI